MAKYKESSQIFVTQGEAWKWKNVFGDDGRQGWLQSFFLWIVIPAGNTG